MNARQNEALRPCSRSYVSDTGWRPDFASIRGRVYLAIASQIEQAILAGIFRPGDRLPSQRAIADDLGFHVNTINRAFKEAARRGLVRSCTRRGTIVSFDAPTSGFQNAQQQFADSSPLALRFTLESFEPDSRSRRE